MSIALDAAIVLIIALTLIVCAAKGFIKSVFGVLKFVVSFILASIFKGTVAVFIMEHNLYTDARDAATGKIAEMVSRLGENFDSEGLVNAFREKNPALFAFLEQLGVSDEGTKSAVENAAREGCEDLSVALAEYIVHPIMESIAYVLGFLLVFVAAFLALCLVQWLLGVIFRLPVLNAINKLGGVVVGLILAVLYSSLFVILTSPIVSNPEIVGGEWSADAAEKTYIYSYIEENNIISDIFG
ncbi:MAG: CvpA family protein [Clostridia bacterium]|nr:CvpA family protein [Clostridia bacterium]